MRFWNRSTPNRMFSNRECNEIIKGECLAMRAYCHFDLLRLFGPMPTRTTASKILLYVTKVGIEYNTHHSYQEFTELLKTI